MSNDRIHVLPGGQTRTISGGTRTQIKLSRPWQQPFEVNSAKCPFCTKPQKEIPLLGIPHGWKLLPNPITPHKDHRLVIPDRCWNVETLWRLGGSTGLMDALTAISLTIQNCDTEIAAFIHVGALAGQNLGHPHWHVLDPEVQQPFELQNVDLDDKYLIDDQGSLAVIAAGARSGECIILPVVATSRTLNFRLITEVAGSLSWLITHCNAAFRSEQGLPPEFIVTIRVAADGTFRYADYCPILNQWGAPQNVLGPLEGGPLTLPWPHEVTASYLRVR